MTPNDFEEFPQQRYALTGNERLFKFSKAYDAIQAREGQSLLCIMATGGGMGISGLGIVPGASGRLAGTFHPYSMDELWEFVKTIALKNNPNAVKEDWRSVHTESSLMYLEALKAKYPGKYFYIASTAALETTRRRRGENVSYIAVCRPDGSESSWKLFLSKEEDSKAIEYIRGKEIQVSPDESWDRMYKYKDVHGQDQIDLNKLMLARQIQDNKVTAAMMAIILNDPSFAHLYNKDKLIKLTENGKEVNEDWAVSKER